MVQMKGLVRTGCNIREACCESMLGHSLPTWNCNLIFAFAFKPLVFAVVDINKVGFPGLNVHGLFVRL